MKSSRQYIALSPLYSEHPKRSTFAIIEDPDVIQHKAAFHAEWGCISSGSIPFAKVKTFSGT